MEGCVSAVMGSGRPIPWVISTDAEGFGKNATLIASIVRRTERLVWARCYTRGFLPESFAVRNLRVDYVGADEAVTGRGRPLGRANRTARDLHAQVPASRKSRSSAAPSNGTTITLLPWVSLPFSSSLGTSSTAKVKWVTWPFSRNTAGRSIFSQ